MTKLDDLIPIANRIAAASGASGGSLPAAMYGDMEAGFKQGVPYAQSFRDLYGASQGLGANATLDAVARYATAHTKTGAPREAEKPSFWSRATDFAKALIEPFRDVVHPSEIPGDLARVVGTGLNVPLGGNVAREANQFIGDVLGEARFTDQIIGFVDLPGHLVRAGIEADLRGDPDEMWAIKDVLPNFLSRSFRNAWRVTQHGEDYFRNEPANDLPKLQRDIAKSYLSGSAPVEIANNLGGEWDENLVDLVLEAPATKTYMEGLKGQQISWGRELARGNFFGDARYSDNTGFKPGSQPYKVVSGALDLIFNLAAPGADTAAASFAKRALESGRYFEVAARSVEDLDRVLHNRGIDRVLRSVSNTHSAAAILENIKLPGRRQIPVELANAWAEVPAGDVDAAREVLRIAATGGGRIGENNLATLYEIPRTSFTGRFGDVLIRWETGDGLQRRAANYLNRVRTGFSEVPREVDLADRTEAYRFTSNLIDSFPRVFGPGRRRELLDETLGLRSSGARWDLSRRIWKEAMDNANLPQRTKELARPLYDRMLKFRAFMIDPDTGEELSRMTKEVLGEMVDTAAPHLGSQFSGSFPVPALRDMRELRWSQGSFSKVFSRHPWMASPMLGMERFQKSVWIPLTLATRPAWVMRVEGDSLLRMSAVGQGPLTHPVEWWRAKTARVQSARGGRWRSHPFSVLPSTDNIPLDDMPKALIQGKSRLVSGDLKSSGRFSPKMASAQVPVRLAGEEQMDRYAFEGWQNSLREMQLDRTARELLGRADLEDGTSIADVADMLRNDPNWAAYREHVGEAIARAGGEEDYVLATATQLAALIHNNPGLEEMMMQIARGEKPLKALTSRKGRSFLRDQANIPNWVKRPLAYDNGPRGAFGRGISVAYEYLMDRSDAYLSRLPFHDINKADAVASGTAFARKHGRLLGDAELIERYKAAWETKIRDTVTDLRTRADEIDVPIRPRAGAFDPVFLGQEAKRSATLRKGADFYEQRLRNGPRASELDDMALNDGFVTDRVINDSAKAYANSRVFDVLYDNSARKWWQAQVLPFSPFIAAWWEVFDTWSRIIGENPMVAQKAGRLGKLALGTKEGGEQKTAPVGLDYAVRFLTGSAVEFTSPLDSFNIFTQNPYPGAGPMVQLFAGVLADFRPDWEDALTLVSGGYGIREMRGAGLNRYFTLARESLLPAWMTTALNYFESPEGSDQFFNAAGEEFRKLALDRFGEGVPTDPKVLQDTWQEAIDRARKVFLLQGFAKAFFPGSIARDFPWRDQVARYFALSEVVGKDEATDALIEEMGPGAAFLVNPFSRASMKSTKEAQKIARDPRFARFVNDKNYQSLFWALYDRESQGTYDPSVYRWQHAQGQRTAKDAFQIDPSAGQYTPGWVEAPQVEEGWRVYSSAREQADAMIADGSVSRDQASAAMQAVRLKLAFRYPLWGIASEGMRNTSWRNQRLQNEMEDLAAHLPPSQSRDGLRVYLSALRQSQTMLRDMGLSGNTFDANAAEPIRAALQHTAERIVQMYPDFRAFYTKHLRFTLDPAAQDVTPLVEQLAS